MIDFQIVIGTLGRDPWLESVRHARPTAPTLLAYRQPRHLLERDATVPALRAAAVRAPGDGTWTVAHKDQVRAWCSTFDAMPHDAYDQLLAASARDAEIRAEIAIAARAAYDERLAVHRELTGDDE